MSPSFFSDLLAPRNVVAEPDNGRGTAQQRGSGGVKGGASTSTPTRGKPQESGEEAEVNRQDEKKGGSSSGGGSSGSSGGSSEIEAKVKDCVSSSSVNPAKKQYSDCVSQGKGDCTSELVNLAQRITQCAAPEKF